LRGLTRFTDHLPHLDFPESLLDSPALGRLMFKGSRLDGVPAELFGDNNCLEQLRSHFRDLEEGSDDVRDVKVVVLGNGRIGKTQLCGQLKGDSYENGAESTHGILVSSAELGTDRLHLWDFGGQELYHGTHSLFMRTRAVFVVLWTPDSENQQEHEWNGMTFRNHRLDY
jgi:internalin A